MPSARSFSLRVPCSPVLVASRVLYRGESLLSFKLQAGGFIAFFRPRHSRSALDVHSADGSHKKKGLAGYGLLAQSYVERLRTEMDVHDPPLPRNSSDLAISSHSRTSATAMPWCAKCVPSPSDSRTSRVWRPPPRLPLASPAHRFLSGRTYHAHHQSLVRVLETS